MYAHKHTMEAHLVLERTEVVHANVRGAGVAHVRARVVSLAFHHVEHLARLLAASIGLVRDGPNLLRRVVFVIWADEDAVVPVRRFWLPECEGVDEEGARFAEKGEREKRLR